MPSEIAIKVDGLSKCYQVYDSPLNRLKQFILPKIRSVLGLKAKDYYREFWALKNISFEIRRGETVGVIGRNGAGKSTLLQLLSGTLYPTDGCVEIVGRVAALLELGSGFNPEFSGRENVYLNAAVWGLEKKQIDERFEKISNFADIGEFIDQPVKTYSSGMVMRLAFAVIAHVDADVLIVDEALSVGDAFFTQKCMRFLRQFMSQGTVLFVSHDTGAVTSLCERSIWLQDGVVHRDGSPKEIADSYLEDLFREKQGEGASILKPVERAGAAAVSPDALKGDQRLKYLNLSKYRNDIELFGFNPDADGFGLGSAHIVDVGLYEHDGSHLRWCVGGESVLLKVRCLARKELSSPVVGFYVKDRLGQTLFGANTYLAQLEAPRIVRESEEFEASFEFCMPVLPVGDYSICVAIAEGTRADHIQHQWIHDAVLFKSHASSELTALVGIPMQSISLDVMGA